MKVKYNKQQAANAENQEYKDPKPGMYIAKVREINEWSGQYGPGFEVVLEVVSDSKGRKKDIDGIGSRLWTYIYTEYEPTAFRLREFLDAVGVPVNGAFDSDKIVGTEIQVRVKPDTKQDSDEYRARAGKLLALGDAGAEEDEPDEPEEPSAEDEEPDDPDAEPEEPEEPEADDDGEAIDLDTLDRAELKKLIKDEGLEITVYKSTTDEQIREQIAEALGGAEEPEPDEEPEPEEPEEEGVDLDALDRAELKAFIKDNELDVTVYKTWDEDKIRAAIREAMPDDAKPDYSKWDGDQLKAEIKERGLELDGRYSDKKAREALAADDASDTEPF